MTKFVDLNHIIEDGMDAYPGLPSPQIGSLLDHTQSRSRYDWKAEFYLGKVDMPCNLGT
jgi:kynurenine formamidase